MVYGQSNGCPKSQFYQFYMQLNNVFNAFFVIYLAVINASMEESTNVIKNSCTIGQLFCVFYDLFVLTERAVLAYSTLSGMFI
jgi:hypothetical protein